MSKKGIIILPQISANDIDETNLRPGQVTIFGDSGKSGNISMKRKDGTVEDLTEKGGGTGSNTGGTSNPVTSEFDSRKLSKFSIQDKSYFANNTTGDNVLAMNNGITEEPLDGSYIEVKVNGVDYTVGDASKSTDCYFSADGGTTAKSFNSSHINGKVNAGDRLYWNGNNAGFNLVSTWKISLNYLRSDYDQLVYNLSLLQGQLDDLSDAVVKLQAIQSKVQADYDNAVAAGDTKLASKLQNELNEFSSKITATNDEIDTVQAEIDNLETEINTIP